MWCLVCLKFTTLFVIVSQHLRCIFIKLYYKLKYGLFFTSPVYFAVDCNTQISKKYNYTSYKVL